MRGALVENAPLAPATWLRVGGPAQVLFLPADEADLARFLAETPRDIAITVLGAASNTLVRDGGVEGVVVRLTKAFAGVAPADDAPCALQVGAGALDKRVAQEAARASIAGLEFLVGVPGAIGGAARMNAGCYGRETKDVLTSLIALDRTGRRIVASPEELGFSYRHSAFPDDWIVVSVQLQGRPGEQAEIEAEMDAITRRREDSQPIRARTGGSTFANPDPPEAPNPRKSWELIDKAGARGLAVGGASMSTQHCNFMINDGTATAADFEALGEEVRRRVKMTSGVDLRWEIRRIGVPA